MFIQYLKSELIDSIGFLNTEIILGRAEKKMKEDEFLKTRNSGPIMDRLMEEKIINGFQLWGKKGDENHIVIRKGNKFIEYKKNLHTYEFFKKRLNEM